MRYEIVTFTSDYGLQDEFVGVCRGVMLKIAHQVRIVDVHHYILRQDIRHGAIVLKQSIPFLPEAVHLAVVDPTVGGGRKPVAIRAGNGHLLVGPDNGLLMPAVEVCGGVDKAFVIEDERWVLTPVSRTFQGRDVFAPVAAHLANGVEPSELGAELPANELVGLEIPEAWVHDDHLHAEVLQVDRFGNLQFNFDASHLDKVGLAEGKRLEVRVEGHRLNVALGRTFADVEDGDFVLMKDSYHQLSLAINQGDAGAKLRAKAGSTAIVGPAPG